MTTKKVRERQLSMFRTPSEMAAETAQAIAAAVPGVVPAYALLPIGGRLCPVPWPDVASVNAMLDAASGEAVPE